MTLILTLIGLLLLLAGAELLVRGASHLATAFAIPPLVIGLTVVAFGTSAPELAVSVGAALTGRGDIAFGNVVGSNIFNILLILGVSALITPLAVSQKLVRLEVPIMISVSLLVVILGWNGSIGRVESTLLVSLGIVYTVFQIRAGRQEAALAGSSQALSSKLWPPLATAVVGLGMLILGARWLVEGTSTLARALGISELIIGLTVVAAGTSLPEVATSVVASLKGEREIAVGNVVGSNVFNILFVLGLTGAIADRGVRIPQEAWGVDIPVMVVAAVVCLPIAFTGYRIARWEGGLLLIFYLGYISLLVATALRSPTLHTSRFAFLGFVVP